jgi:hypothetical protein
MTRGGDKTRGRTRGDTKIGGRAEPGTDERGDESYDNMRIQTEWSNE